MRNQPGLADESFVESPPTASPEGGFASGAHLADPGAHEALPAKDARTRALGRAERLGLDVRQLRFLSALLRTQSITLAGKSTGQSQPTASRTYQRLKTALADPLVVRTGNVAVLTPFAQALERHVGEAVKAIDAMFAAIPFDPASDERTFNVAVSEFVGMKTLWPALADMKRLAPSSSLSIHGWDAGTIERLEKGGIDFALHVSPVLPPAFHSRSLLKAKYALVCPQAHPLAAKSWTEGIKLLQASARFMHFGLRIADSHWQSTRSLYAEAGLEPPPIAFESERLIGSPETVLADDLVAIVPGDLAREWVGAGPYAVIPIQAPQLSLEYRLVWHGRVHRHPANAWARSVIVQALAAVASPSKMPRSTAGA